MTIHKIDREKLAEAVEYSQEATPRIDGEYWTTMRQAAENWLAITDPGFEPSEEMVEAGDNESSRWFVISKCGRVGIVVEGYIRIFKAMIATTIGGQKQ